MAQHQSRKVASPLAVRAEARFRLSLTSEKPRHAFYIPDFADLDSHLLTGLDEFVKVIKSIME